MPFHPDPISGHSFLRTFFEVGACLRKPSNYWYYHITQGIFSSYFPTEERRMSWWSVTGLLSPPAICWLRPRICSPFSFISIFIKPIHVHRLGQNKLTIKCKLLPPHCTFLSSPLIVLVRGHHILSELFLLQVCSPFLSGEHAYPLNYWFQVLLTNFIIRSMIFVSYFALFLLFLHYSFLT